MPQSLCTIRVHLVFSTKHRKPTITTEIEPELYAYMAEILKNLDSPAIAIGGTEDHVHILFSLSKNHALTKVVESLKGDSSKWMKTKGTAFQSFYWQTGYAAFSIGKSGESELVQYIRNQKTHHKNSDFKTELRALLDKYELIYNEDYLWDEA